MTTKLDPDTVVHVELSSEYPISTELEYSPTTFCVVVTVISLPRLVADIPLNAGSWPYMVGVAVADAVPAMPYASTTNVADLPLIETATVLVLAPAVVSANVSTCTPLHLMRQPVLGLSDVDATADHLMTACVLLTLPSAITFAAVTLVAADGAMAPFVRLTLRTDDANPSSI